MTSRNPQPLEDILDYGLARAKKKLLARRIIRKSGCWYWQGGHSNGTPNVRIGKRNWKVARVAAVVWLNLRDKNRQVNHTCRHNLKCWNPKHLYIGTHQDNMKDMIVDGTAAKGVHNGNSRFNEHDIREIRKMATNGVSDSVIGEQFHISRVYVHRIRTRKVWADL